MTGANMRSVSGYWQVAIVAALLVACGGKKEEAAAAAGTAAAPEEKVVNVFNWSDYIGDTTSRTSRRRPASR